MAIAFVQQATGTALGTNSGTCTISAPAAGNTLFVVMTGSQSDAISSITGGGVTWAKVVGTNVNFDGEIWCGPNSSGSGTTITVNFSGSNNHWFNCSEWSGLGTTATTDVTGSNNGNDQFPTTATITTTNADDLILAVGISISTLSSGPTNSFTALNTPDSTRLVAAYRIVSSTNSYSTSWVFGGSSAWETQIASFKAASGGSPVVHGVPLIGRVR